MMEGLAAWLKQIVAVVLLAGLVDLILPNRTMQRYVRLVAGLLILLTVATPLLNFLKGDFSGRLAENLGSLEAQVLPQSSSAELSAIEAEGQRWRQEREREAFVFAAAQMEEAIRLDVEQSENRPVEQVKVALERDAEGSVTVQGVTVTLANGTPAEAEDPSSRPIAYVEPVAPVIVDVEPGERQVGGEAENPAPDPQTRWRIASLIAARYGVPAGRVIVAEAERNGENGR